VTSNLVTNYHQLRIYFTPSLVELGIILFIGSILHNWIASVQNWSEALYIL